MTDDEFERYQKLEAIISHSKGICDPIEFFKRKDALLRELSEFILYPYREELKQRKLGIQKLN